MCSLILFFFIWSGFSNAGAISHPSNVQLLRSNYSSNFDRRFVCKLPELNNERVANVAFLEIVQDFSFNIEDDVDSHSHYLGTLCFDFQGDLMFLESRKRKIKNSARKWDVLTTLNVGKINAMFEKYVALSNEKSVSCSDAPDDLFEMFHRRYDVSSMAVSLIGKERAGNSTALSYRVCLPYDDVTVVPDKLNFVVLTSWFDNTVGTRAARFWFCPTKTCPGVHYVVTWETDVACVKFFRERTNSTKKILGTNVYRLNAKLDDGGGNKSSVQDLIFDYEASDFTSMKPECFPLSPNEKYHDRSSSQHRYDFLNAIKISCQQRQRLDSKNTIDTLFADAVSSHVTSSSSFLRFETVLRQSFVFLFVCLVCY